MRKSRLLECKCNGFMKNRVLSAGPAALAAAPMLTFQLKRREKTHEEEKSQSGCFSSGFSGRGGRGGGVYDRAAVCAGRAKIRAAERESECGHHRRGRTGEDQRAGAVC